MLTLSACPINLVVDNHTFGSVTFPLKNDQDSIVTGILAAFNNDQYGLNQNMILENSTAQSVVPQQVAQQVAPSVEQQVAPSVEQVAPQQVAQQPAQTTKSIETFNNVLFKAQHEKILKIIIIILLILVIIGIIKY
jgi:hypothetical protein